MDLISQYRLMHEAGHFKGYSVLPHVETIRALIRQTDAKTLLDWGCGQGLQYSEHKIHQSWGIEPFLYDPAVPGIDRKPQGIFGGVICTDVLEHLPLEDVYTTLAELLCHASRFLFLTVCTRPARKVLPDGRNCHLSVYPESWWRNIIATARDEFNPTPIVKVEWNV